MSNRYEIRRSTAEGLAVFELVDRQTAGKAEVVPEIGNNAIRFESGGRSILESPADLANFHIEPNYFRYGTPLLFPPNRIRDGEWTYRGKTYRLPLNEPPDYHLHGRIAAMEWKVVEFGASEQSGAFVVSRFRYAEHPDMLETFPHPIAFTFTYRLKDGKLRLEGTIVNEGEEEAPFAFGLHPYFSFSCDPEDVAVTLPAKHEWPVTPLSFVTGLPAETAFSRLIAAEGVRLGDFPPLSCRMLELREGEAVCRMACERDGYAIEYRLDGSFPFALLFRPDWSQSFSIEPYTCLTDAFHLPYDAARTGVRGIAPGETFAFATSVGIAAIS